MDKQFDELSKSLAEGVSRRNALKKFGLGLAGVLLASAGLAKRAEACSTTICPPGTHCCPGLKCVELTLSRGQKFWACRPR